MYDCCPLLNIFLIVQVLIEKFPNSEIRDIDQRKFIVSDQYTFAELLSIIRRRLNVPQEKAIALFVDDTSIMPPLW